MSAPKPSAFTTSSRYLLVLTRVERGRLEVEASHSNRGASSSASWPQEAPELPSIRISLDLEPHLPIVAGEATVRGADHA